MVAAASGLNAPRPLEALVGGFWAVTGWPFFFA